MESNGHFKVGVSDNPRKRLKSLSIGNCDISLIYESQKLSNAYCVEGYLHKTFSGFGVGGEWFKIEDKSEVLGEVKKAVATFKKGDGRTYSKVIKMVKSPKTGAYIFQEEMIPNEAVKDYFAK